MKNNLAYFVVALLIVLLLISVCDPFMLLMPASLAMTVLIVVTVLVCIFAAFVLKEQPGDEREMIHRLEAGRTAYLIGIGILTLGVLIEGLQKHQVDVWLALALGAMIVAKLASRFYADRYR